MFENIILIDDDYASNYYNSYIVNSLNCCKNLVVLNDVDQATEFLSDFEQNLDPCNNQFSLICLDINMPKYTGFELIDRNLNIFNSLHSKNSLIYILTTSENPLDVEKSISLHMIEGFCPKPLSEESLKQAYDSAQARINH